MEPPVPPATAGATQRLPPLQEARSLQAMPAQLSLFLKTCLTLEDI